MRSTLAHACPHLDQVAVLLNAHAGRVGAPPLPDGSTVSAAFAAHHLNVTVYQPAPGEWDSALTQALEGRPRYLIVGGGDGSVSAAAARLRDHPTTLGILPFGTLNHFAKDLGLPTDWREAIAVIAAGHTRRVDLGEVNGRTFLNTCSLGGYTRALRHREALRRRAHGKWRAMFWGTWAALRRVPRLRVTLLSDDWPTVALRASFVLVANNRYRDDALLNGARTDLSSGRLWLYASPAHRYRDLLKTAVDAWRHGLHRAPQLVVRRAPAFTVATEPELVHVALDGELALLETPLRFHSCPGALTVLAPRLET